MSKYSNFLAVTEDRMKNYQLQLDKLDVSIQESSALISQMEKSRELMNMVGSACQLKVKEVVERLVSEAFEVVFGDNYKFELEMAIVRNQPEVSMFVIQDGKKRSMKDEQGGGVIDLISFVLRIVMWSITTPRTAGVMILDEPGKFISKNLQQVFGEMITELSRMLGIQFLMVSHEEELINTADVTYSVHLEEEVSFVERVEK
jgi:DNA repair exonuclease SbcCD ATPase subunit